MLQTAVLPSKSGSSHRLSLETCLLQDFFTSFKFNDVLNDIFATRWVLHHPVCAKIIQLFEFIYKFTDT